MRPLQLSGDDNSIFTHVNYFMYEAPPGFNFGTRFQNEPIVDNVNSSLYNVKIRADEFVGYFRK